MQNNSPVQLNKHDAKKRVHIHSLLCHRARHFFWVLKFNVACAMTNRLFKQANWNEYRQQVSILCPRGYEPRALPLRHAGYITA